MSKKIKILIIISAFLLVLSVPVFIFFTREPVLIVTEQSFLYLYGENRLKREIIINSLRLFRQIKMVAVTNDAGDDIVPHAITEISNKPYCVLFPQRFSRSAVIYHEQNPSINIVMMEGRNNQSAVSANINPDLYFSFRTDVESDFYRAGVAAAAYSEESNGYIAVFMEPRQNSVFGSQARQAFQRGLNELNYQLEPLFYTSYSEYYDFLELSCVVLAGAGWEYYDNRAGIPVILFAWLDPFLAPSDTVMVIDDSPVAQVYQVVSFINKNEKSGNIKSNFTVLNAKNVSNEVLRTLK